MSRSKPKKDFQPGYWVSREKITKIQAIKILETLGLDQETDTSACASALDSITRALGHFLVSEQQEQQMPRPSALIKELEPLLTLCKKFNSKIMALSPLATTEIERAIMLSLDRVDREFRSDDLASTDNIQRVLRDLPNELSSLERHLMLAIENLKPQKSQGATQKMALRCLIRSLEDIFERYAQDDDNTPETCVDFIWDTLSCRKISLPENKENLRPYLRSH